jgi:hypothetical protein
MPRPLSRYLAALVVLAASVLVTRGADAQSATERDMDAYTFTGLGTALNFRGAGNEFDADFTLATNSHTWSPVLTTRLSTRMMVWPQINNTPHSWGGWIGVRTAVFRYQPPEGSDPPGGGFPANVEPTVGFLAASAGDEVRFEADVAPVLAPAEASAVTSQAAIIAAMSTSPHDDLLFVPNVQGGARFRLAVSRRFRWYRTAFFEVGADVEAGYAKAASAIGTTAGGTGGGRLYAKVFLRPDPGPRRGGLEGLAVETFADVGYTAIWPAAVVVPVLIGGGLTFDVCRQVELRAFLSSFSADPIKDGGGFQLGSLATTIGLRFTLGAEEDGWTQRQIDAQPEFGDYLPGAGRR